MTKKDMFGDAMTAPKLNWVKFENISDGIKGTYVGTFINTNEFSGRKHKNYIVLKDGEYFAFSGRGGIKNNPEAPKVCYELQNAELGMTIGAQFTEERECSKPNPIKIIKGYLFPLDKYPIDTEAVDEYEKIAKYFFEKPKEDEEIEEVELPDFND